MAKKAHVFKGHRMLTESVRRGNFAKYLFLGVWFPGKSYQFLQNFEKALLEKLICSYGISFSWKIVCVLAEFWESSSFWKFWCVLIKCSFDVFSWKNSPGRCSCYIQEGDKGRQSQKARSALGKGHFHFG